MVSLDASAVSEKILLIAEVITCLYNKAAKSLSDDATAGCSGPRAFSPMANVR